MKKEVEVHSSGEVIEVVHEEDNPEKGKSFEGIDNVPEFDYSGSS